MLKTDFFDTDHPSENQEIPLSRFLDTDVSLFLKREDRIHPYVSGNKFRKLKYIFRDISSKRKKSVLTFGGAHSNHIAAVAAAGKMFGIHTLGLIRGQELASEIKLNPTLSFATECGMRLIYMDRADYRLKHHPEILEKYILDIKDYYLIPEGGTSDLAVKGCEEILTVADAKYEYICVAVGTGGTFAGLLNALGPAQTGIGFSALKGTFQKETIENYSNACEYQLVDDYCFGGYAKIDPELVRFINNFRTNTGILLDPVYTAKMMYGILKMIEAKKFRKNSRILAIHTGGLQGIEAMNRYLKKKNLPQIET